MSFHADLSLNTLIISIVVGIAGFALKGALWAVGEICKRLIEKLIETISRVEVLDTKMTDLITAVGDVQKIRTDLNGFYARLKELEDRSTKV